MVKVLGIAFVMLLLLLVGCTQTAERSQTTSPSSHDIAQTTGGSGGKKTAETTSKLHIMTIHASSGKDVRVRVEIADNIFEQARGLMHRNALARNRGMLFVYRDEEKRSFWMKNTLIPLSIAFMDSEGRIVDIQDMKPEGLEQTVPDAKLPRYVSAEPAKYALEVNQGFFEERGVKVGDRAALPV